MVSDIQNGMVMIQTMVKIAGRNGNYLLDMAPGPDGSMEEAQKKLFAEIGSRTKIYGESVYGTEDGTYLPIKGDFVSTRKNNKIFLHLLSGQTSITLPAFENKIVSSKLLATTEKVVLKKVNNKFIFSVPTNYKMKMICHLIPLLKLNITKPVNLKTNIHEKIFAVI